MFIKTKRGFTLIELIMVITILGILAIIAIPRFIDLRTEARKATAAGIDAAGESGAQLWRAMYLIDSTGSYSIQFPSVSTDCFDEVPDVTGFTVTYESTTGHFTVAY